MVRMVVVALTRAVKQDQSHAIASIVLVAKSVDRLHTRVSNVHHANVTPRVAEQESITFLIKEVTLDLF